MASGKNPILTVLLIIAAVGLLLSILIFIISGVSGRWGSISFADKIGVIPIKGKIEDSTAILSQIDHFTKDSSIKAIIIRINSPGGNVGASQEIFQQLRKISKKKVVVASMEDIAASGAYYIACGANKIIANPGTITGSIGVIVEFLQLKELLKKLGIGLEVIKTGEFKDLGSPHREITQKERELIENLLFDIREQFVHDVSKSRHLPLEKVSSIADGRILTGKMAKELGLVDALGNFMDAIDIAKHMAGIKGEPKIVYPRRQRIGLLDILLNNISRRLVKGITNNSVVSGVYYLWPGFRNQ